MLSTAICKIDMDTHTQLTKLIQDFSTTRKLMPLSYIWTAYFDLLVAIRLGLIKSKQTATSSVSWNCWADACGSEIN